MRFFLTITFILFLSEKFISQINPEKQHKLDSLKQNLQQDSLHTYRYKSLKSYANISNQQSFSLNRPADILNYQLGLIIKEQHALALGFSHLNTFRQSHSPAKDGFNVPVLEYFSLFYRYTVFHEQHFKLDIPLEIGFSSYHTYIIDTALKVNFNPDKKNSYIPLSTGIKLVLKPVQWIGLSLMTGYRYVYDKNAVLNLNTFFYSIGIWVDFRQTCRDLKYYGYQKKKYKRNVREVLKMDKSSQHF